LGYLPDGYILTPWSEVVLEYRRKYNLSVKQVAKQIGIDPTTLHKVENGQIEFKFSGKRIENFVQKISMV